MRLTLLPSAALAACLALTSCASSTLPVTVQPKPLPPEYAVRCPDPVATPADSPDQVVLALKAQYDLYGTCAGRFTDLLNWLETNYLKTP